ncbi:MAG: hypothetical protein JSS22_11335 [Proteobacteria bacterium]|nr:hypothetical protein [Pseudomonadota bacterium]
MLKYASKFFFEKIMPSVVATVAGAYIVNHYIVSKPADVPVAAAVSAATPDKAVSNIPEAGVRAKGISEKTIAKEQAAKVQPEKTAEKPAEEPVEAASLSADIKKHPTPPHEKAVAKVTPAPTQTVSVPDDHRDANDLARAAINRLRTSDAPVRVEASRSQPEASRPRQDASRQPVDSTSTPPRVQEAARTAPQPAMQPLPPAIQVSVPAVETFNPDAGRTMEKPQSDGADNARRLVPPADIPEASRPLDLEASAAPPEIRTHTTVADDVLSAAKSVFRAVIPR